MRKKIEKPIKRERERIKKNGEKNCRIINHKNVGMSLVEQLGSFRELSMYKSPIHFLFSI
jgi:hypothetical protein